MGRKPKEAYRSYGVCKQQGACRSAFDQSVDIFVDTKILCIYRCFSYFLTGVNKNIKKTFQ